MFAIHSVGGQAIALNPLYTSSELKGLISDAEPEIILYDDLSHEVVVNLEDFLKSASIQLLRMGENYKPTGQKEYYKGRAFSAGDEVIDEDGAEQEINNEWKGWGTALKPAHEPIVMARKFIEGTNKNNREKYGTGGINIDGCRIELSEGDDPRLGGKGTWKTDGMAKNVYGDYKGRENGSSELGRFPANVMHDGSEEVVSGFPNAKGAVSNGDASVGETSEGVIKPLRRGKLTSYADDGSAARFFYCPKVSKSERGEDNTHPTVKPQELMKYLCRLVTPKGGTVLDPFMGSGSTGMAAKDEEFKFIGIEKEKEYFEIAESRITRFAPLMNFM